MSMKRKENLMRHFMVDFIEINMRKIAYNNATFCAQKVGYFNQNNTNFTQLDCDFEKCLSKFSDSYESSLEVLTQHLHVMNETKEFSHSQELKSDQSRANAFMMGGGVN